MTSPEDVVIEEVANMITQEEAQRVKEEPMEDDGGVTSSGLEQPAAGASQSTEMAQPTTAQATQPEPAADAELQTDGPEPDVGAELEAEVDKASARELERLAGTPAQSTYVPQPVQDPEPDGEASCTDHSEPEMMLEGADHPLPVDAFGCAHLA